MKKRTNFDGVRWTPHETEILKEAVSKFRRGNVVDWRAMQNVPEWWDVVSANGKRSVRAIQCHMHSKGLSLKSRKSPKDNGEPTHAVETSFKLKLQYCPCCGADLRAFVAAATL